MGLWRRRGREEEKIWLEMAGGRGVVGVLMWASALIWTNEGMRDENEWKGKM
jgi:hypothetical protein